MTEGETEDKRALTAELLKKLCCSIRLYRTLIQPAASTSEVTTIRRYRNLIIIIIIIIIWLFV